MPAIQFYAHETARKSGQKFEYHLRVTNGGKACGASISISQAREKISSPSENPFGKKEMRKDEANFTLIHLFLPERSLFTVFRLNY